VQRWPLLASLARPPVLMPRGLSPVNAHAHVHGFSYSSHSPDNFNPWPHEACAKRQCLGVDEPLLRSFVELPLEPCAKRQRLGAERSTQLPQLPDKPHARFCHDAAEFPEVKRRRLDSQNIELDSVSEAGVKIEELEDDHGLCLVPAGPAAKAYKRAACNMGLTSHSPAAILNCIREAFASPSWEPSIQPFPRPWIVDNEDGLELDNLIIFKDGMVSAEQVSLRSVPDAIPDAPLADEHEEEEPSLPGLIIFNENINVQKPAARENSDLPCRLHIDEIEEVHMDTSGAGDEILQ